MTCDGGKLTAKREGGGDVGLTNKQIKAKVNKNVDDWLLCMPGTITNGDDNDTLFNKEITKTLFRPSKE